MLINISELNRSFFYLRMQNLIQMNIRLFICSLFILWFGGCTNDKEVVLNKLEEIDLSKGFYEDKKSNLSEVATELINIPLETRPECVIGNIRKVLYLHDRLLVFDKQTQKLYIFDINGRYLDRIDQIGRGPSEYLQITDFTASATREEIVIYDDRQQKILKYDLSGNFIEAHHIDYWPLKVAFTPDQKQLALMCPQPLDIYADNTSISFMDLEWKPTARLIRHKIEDVEEHKRKIITPHNFFTFKDSLTIWENSCDTVYRITKDFKVLPRFLIKLGEEAMPKELAAYQDMHMQYVFDYASIDKVLEVENYLFVSGIYKGFLKEIFYNKKTKECYNSVFHYTYKDNGFHNDLDGGAPFWPSGIAADGWVYSHFQPFELKEYWGLDYFKAIKEKHPDKKKELQGIIDRSKVDDNPIVQLVRLK